MMSASVADAKTIAYVEKEAQKAIRFHHENLLAANSAGKTKGSAENSADDLNNALQKSLREHVRALKRVSKAAGKSRKQWALARDLMLKSFSSRVCAIARALHRHKKHLPLGEMLKLAAAVDLWKPLTEKVTARWREKNGKKGKYRLIVTNGPIRTAYGLLLRDALSVMGVDNEFDFTRKGGGERPFVQGICKAIDEGVHYWWTPDIVNFFASLRPGHLKWMPVDKRVLTHAAFVHKCAGVKVIINKDTPKIAMSLSDDPTTPMSTVSLCLLTTRKVRQGSPQGSVLSPLLARGFVGRELRETLGEMEVEKSSFQDDLAIGACAKKIAEEAKCKFTKRLLNHPAGPIKLHSSAVTAAQSSKVQVLGYMLEPGNGFGDNPVHVKPGPKRIARFKSRLRERLKDASKDDDLLEVGISYWRNWFSSQQAWTKVPLFTEELSLNITHSYVHDFEHYGTF
jgi:hypothetical protein